MAAKDGAKEKEKEKEKDEKKEKEKDGGVINAVYKVNLHCRQCGREIKKPLMATPGVHNVEVDMEKGEIKAKGVFDPVQIQKRLEKLCKKKIELVSPKIQIKETPVIEKKIVKEPKEPTSRTILVKVNMHCNKCEQDLKKKLIKRKVEGTIEPEKLVSYLRKKVHKHAEIVPPKPEKKEETKEKEKGASKPEEKKEETKEKGKGASKPAEKKEETKEKEKGASKPAEKQEEKKEKDSGEKSSEPITRVVETRGDMQVVEVKPKESNAPYFIHYVYAPQTFSDENPNACYIM
ncbi:PREDICTED: heavy metal-associated isoprenylated plant protein 3 isoform X2 [Prunus mume]|uniref:Heavy metal-associated isoprenylated plant protein 3 isoform X2 n=1 Tax=Prunus mume TaxID=102107 RepID=A0ABM0NZL2_PRUMU|nr:PREDICTED: heavy metal-associated isoprenylated plant protein 3 isoform X2 [Prunus mume]